MVPSLNAAPSEEAAEPPSEDPPLEQPARIPAAPSPATPAMRLLRFMAGFMLIDMRLSFRVRTRPPCARLEYGASEVRGSVHEHAVSCVELHPPTRFECWQKGTRIPYKMRGFFGQLAPFSMQSLCLGKALRLFSQLDAYNKRALGAHFVLRNCYVGQARFDMAPVQ